MQLSGLLRPLKRVKARKLSGRISCVLCGEIVPAGDLLRHKQERHGERQVAIAPRPSGNKKRVWVSVVSGGLPTLGKRR